MKSLDISENFLKRRVICFVNQRYKREVMARWYETWISPKNMIHQKDNILEKMVILEQEIGTAEHFIFINV